MPLNQKLLKTFDFKVTTREALWTEIYASAVEAGFSSEVASNQTDKAVNFIFDQIGPKKEAALRKTYYQDRLRPRPLRDHTLRDSQPN